MSIEVKREVVIIQYMNSTGLYTTSMFTRTLKYARIQMFWGLVSHELSIILVEFIYESQMTVLGGLSYGWYIVPELIYWADLELTITQDERMITQCLEIYVLALVIKFQKV